MAINQILTSARLTAHDDGAPRTLLAGKGRPRAARNSVCSTLILPRKWSISQSWVLNISMVLVGRAARPQLWTCFCPSFFRVPQKQMQRARGSSPRKTPLPDSRSNKIQTLRTDQLHLSLSRLSGLERVVGHHGKKQCDAQAVLCFRRVWALSTPSMSAIATCCKA